MGGGKLLWILLGISLLVSVIAESSRYENEGDDDVEEDEDEGCDPDCEKNCNKLKCASGTTDRDSCGCCECKLPEGEYCYIKPKPPRSEGTGRKDLKLKRRLLPSFLSLTPPYTYAPSTTSLTNNFASYEDNTASSSPTFAEIHDSTVAVNSVAVKTKRNIKLQQPPQNLPIKHRGKYSSESNDLNRNHGKKLPFYDDDTVYYRTCGDYLKCEPLFPLLEGGEKGKNGEDKSFMFGGGGKNPKLKPFYPGAKKSTTAPKRKKSKLTDRLKRGFNFGSYWDHGGSDFNVNPNKNGLLNQPNSDTSDPDNSKNSLLLDDINNFDDYFFNLFFPSSSPFLQSSSQSNKINNNSPRSQEPIVGTCVCRYAVTVCASDGKTYKNICHLKSVSGLGEGSNPEVHVVKEGPCDPPVAGGMAPKIVSAPDHVKNFTGGSAAMSCEVIGDPIPLISWVKTNVNNKTTDLPGDDDSIMTLTQGGPEKHEVTGWLQIMRLRKSHEADYTCVAYNKHGSATKTARLKIEKRGKKKSRRAHKKE